MHFHKKVLRSWIDPNLLDYKYLSLNENAMDFLKENVDKIVWNIIQLNKNAVDFINEDEHKDKIIWRCISSNPNAMTIINKNLHMVHLLIHLNFYNMEIFHFHMLLEECFYIQLHLRLSLWHTCSNSCHPC
jgi:hypothetical protein